ncbi:thioredoxin-disulfide reductase [Peptococcus simiae]|uniref:thioredoxin-disulfide reductase n=1 Tax=Peptococcus simiae TaxID=1643805 RepID=UPI00397F93D0
MYDIAIIGSGPAGMTAGIYARRAGYSVAMFEMGVPGGQAATTDFIENFPGFPGGISGSELMMKFYEQATTFGAEMIFERVTDVDVKDRVKKVTTTTANGPRTYEAKVIILAMGAHPKMLRVPNEGKFRGRGVSYCATCDGFFFKDKDVCVVGGGDVAVEEALYLTKMCHSVTLFHRRDELRANKRSQALAFENEKLHIEWDTVVTELQGDDKLSQVVTKNVKTEEEKTWDFPGCFIFVGYDPNDEVMPAEVACDDHGYALAGEDMATNVPGVYAIGDLRVKDVRQIASAVGDAGVVMYDIERYFREEYEA